MPIDRLFQQTWKITSSHKGHHVWQNSSSTQGIHGTRVAIDWDICTGCLKCVVVCPVDVFTEWQLTTNQVRADPVNEDACLECLACEIICPVDAILIQRTVSTKDTLNALLE